MPLWLQLTAAVLAGLASGIMGAALVPFLQKLRFCEPLEPKEQRTEAAGDRMRPTMGGLLLVFGALFGLAISFALYRTFCVLDSTSVSVQQETRLLLLSVGYALICAAVGFGIDRRIVARKPLRRQPILLRVLAVFLLTALLLVLYGTEDTVLDFGFFRYDAGFLYLPLTAAAGTLLWMCTCALEEEPDGTTISVGGVLLLGLTILLMQAARDLPVLLTLTAAGACMGTLIWNLHPAKCRLGRTGSFWMSGMLTAVCLLSGLHLALLLTAAVYLLNLIPSWKKHGKTLQTAMRQEGLKPWQRIAVLAGFAAFCSVIAVMVYR